LVDAFQTIKGGLSSGPDEEADHGKGLNREQCREHNFG